MQLLDACRCFWLPAVAWGLDIPPAPGDVEAVTDLPPPSPSDDDQRDVLAFLASPASHGLAEAPLRIDTHAAVVFLAGKLAYKVKRAVRYPYLDFSTLERRRAACEAEIALNRPNAPDIYIDAIPIARRDSSFEIGGSGEVAEWAVRMHRFDPDATLDRLADRGSLSDRLLGALAERVVASHERAPRRDGAAATEHFATLIEDNAAAIAASPAIFPAGRAEALTTVWRAAFASCRDILLARGRDGHVRRCHGDLHLRNIVVIDDRPVLFDALEFDERLASSDLLYDLAFLLMDLRQRGLGAAATTLRNRYLWLRDEDSDIAACCALPLFMSMRAAVRAKVAVDTLPHLEAAKRDEARRDAEHYFDLAEACMRPARPRLVALGGLSGSGKTTVSAAIAPRLEPVPGAIHLRSDIERKRLFGVADTTRLPPEAYDAAVTERVYGRLRRKAAAGLAAGQSVVVDAVHDLPEERRAIAEVARAAGAPFAGIWLEAETDELVRRVTARRGDASDADAAVVRAQVQRGRAPIEWPSVTAGDGAEAVAAVVLRELEIEVDDGVNQDNGKRPPPS